MIRNAKLMLLSMLLLAFSGIATIAMAESRSPSVPGSTEVSSNTGSVNLGPNIYILKDPDETPRLEQLLTDRSLDWQTSTELTPNLGVDPAAFWFRHTLRFTSAQSDNYLLEIGYPALDFVDVYFVRNGRVLESYASGDHLPYANRPIAHRNFLFPVPALEPDTELQIFIRVQTAGAVQLPVYLWEQNAFWEQDQFQLMAHTLFIAILMTIALYNLMLFMSMRDTAYLLYVCYIVCLTLTQMGLRGMNYQLLVPESSLLNERMLLVSIGLAVLFASLFARKFMALP